jgi:hypothetical protein
MQNNIKLTKHFYKHLTTQCQLKHLQSLNLTLSQKLKTFYFILFYLFRRVVN